MSEYCVGTKTTQPAYTHFNVVPYQSLLEKIFLAGQKIVISVLFCMMHFRKGKEEGFVVCFPGMSAGVCVSVIVIVPEDQRKHF